MERSFDGRFLCQDGVELSYTSTGEGFPVVLVNGLGNLKEAWRETVDSFSRYFQVITYNYRNQGKNVSGHGFGYTTRQHVADLACLLDHLEIGSFAAAGISTGARILMEFAQTRSDMVRGLVLMGVATENLDHRNSIIFRSWLNALETSTDDDMRRYVETYIPWIYGPDYLSTAPAPVEQIARGLSNTMTKAGTAANITATWKSLGLQRTSELSAIPAPTLILQGEYDLMAPPGCLQGLSGKFADYRMEIIPRAGHNIRGENRAAFERFALRFLVDELDL